MQPMYPLMNPFQVGYPSMQMQPQMPVQQQLHAEATKLVQEAENKAVEYPQAMRDKWDAQHKAAIEKTVEAKTYLGMFK